MVGWERETTGISIFARYLVGREWYTDFLSVTIWMGTGQHDLAGNDLGGNGTVDLSQNVPSPNYLKNTWENIFFLLSNSPCGIRFQIFYRIQYAKSKPSHPLWSFTY